MSALAELVPLTPPAPAEANYVLARVASVDREILAKLLEPVSVGIGEVLVRPEEPTQWAYFPQSFIASVIALPQSKRIEALSVGREGFTGYQGALLHGRSLAETIVQVAGEGWRIPSAHLDRLSRELPSLRRELERYVLTAMEQTAINAACHRAHTLDQRAARWLLHMADRREAPMFTITHTFLASMLGVRRAGVTLALGKLQDLKMIAYMRGKMHIRDIEGLRRMACECYAIVDAVQRTGTRNQ